MKRLTTLAAVAVLLAGQVWAKDDDKSKSGLRYTITVSTFENKAGWSGQWDIGNGFGEIMTAALQDSGHFIVIGEKDMRKEAMAEQDFATSGRVAGGKKAPKVGRMTPAQLLVKGAITHVQDSTTGGSGGISIAGIHVGGSGDKAEINVTIYLVDSETGQVRASTKVVGKSGRKGLNVGYYGSKLGGLTGDVAAHQKDNTGKACEDAVAQGVEFLEKQLEKIPWEATVVSASGEKIALNRGSRDGVEVGQTFVVGSANQVVDPDSGEVLDNEMNTVGKIEITEVKEKIAYGKPVDGAGKIEKGMSAFPDK